MFSVSAMRSELTKIAAMKVAVSEEWLEARVGPAVGKLKAKAEAGDTAATKRLSRLKQRMARVAAKGQHLAAKGEGLGSDLQRQANTVVKSTRATPAGWRPSLLGVDLRSGKLDKPQLMRQLGKLRHNKALKAGALGLGLAATSGAAMLAHDA